MGNVSHRVNHISFGVDTDISYVKKNFKDTGIVSPLDGIEQIVSERKGGGIDSAIFEYYTKVVPTTYRPLDQPPVNVYQFTANSNKIVNQQMPSLYLRDFHCCWFAGLCASQKHSGARQEGADRQDCMR